MNPQGLRNLNRDLTAPVIPLEQILEVSASPEEEKQAYLAQKNKKATGPEKLPAKVLKMTSMPPSSAPFSQRVTKAAASAGEKGQ